MLTKLEAVVGSWVTGMVEDRKGGVWLEGKVGLLFRGLIGRRNCPLLELLYKPVLTFLSRTKPARSSKSGPRVERSLPHASKGWQSISILRATSLLRRSCLQHFRLWNRAGLL